MYLLSIWINIVFFSVLKALALLSCNCKRSRCSKKYCRCFGANNRCTAACRCFNCKNRKINKLHSELSKTMKFRPPPPPPNDDSFTVFGQLITISGLPAGKAFAEQIPSLELELPWTLEEGIGLRYHSPLSLHEICFFVNCVQSLFFFKSGNFSSSSGPLNVPLDGQEFEMTFSLE